MREYYDMMQSMLDDYAEFEAWEKSGDFKRGIRVNTLKIAADDFKRLFYDIYGSDLVSSPFSPLGFEVDKGYGDSELHRGGLIYMQEPSAMSAVTALSPYMGKKVLDMCAAPGGKSTHAASIMGDDGVIVCNEIIFNRAKVLRSNVERCGVRNAVITSNTPDSLAAALPNYFDTVIVDAPCSGEGMFLKEPQARDAWSIDYVNECAERQYSILCAADKALSVGGVIAYSTCTYNKIENEGVVKKFLAAHDYELLPITGLDGCSSEAFDLPHARRIFPHRHGGLGHFICVMRKVGGGNNNKINFYNPYTAFGGSELNEMWRQIASVGKWCGAYRYKDGIYLLPDNLPLAKGLNIVTAGVKAAEIEHGRLSPHHALAMALRKGETNEPIEVGAKSADMAKYLRGEEIAADGKGYRAVTFNGYPIGLAKVSAGTAKNRYPKGLRRTGRAAFGDYEG